jgi:hypothetical protein
MISPPSLIGMPRASGTGAGGLLEELRRDLYQKLAIREVDAGPVGHHITLNHECAAVGAIHRGTGAVSTDGVDEIELQGSRFILFDTFYMAHCPCLPEYKGPVHQTLKIF